MMRKRKSCFLVLFVLLMYIFPQVTLGNDLHKNNITFTDPYWTMYKQKDAFIMDTVTQMKNMSIKYQFIDLGYFDKNADTGQLVLPINATMIRKHTSQLANWILNTKKVDSDIKSIGVINGSSYMHVQGLSQTVAGTIYTPKLKKERLHEKISEHVKILMDTYDLDGICLDFEPVYNGLTNDYIELIELIKSKIGDEKIIAICGSIDSDAMDNDSIQLYGNSIDMFISMDYDTHTNTDEKYIEHISLNVARISDVLKQTSTQYYPLGPGSYPNNEWHTVSENAKNHSIALEYAIEKYDALLHGSGVWWFSGTMKDDVEIQDFMDYWVK